MIVIYVDPLKLLEPSESLEEYPVCYFFFLFIFDMNFAVKKYYKLQFLNFMDKMLLLFFMIHV